MYIPKMILHFPGLLKLWLQNEIYAINFIKEIAIISKWFFGFEPKYKFQLPLKSAAQCHDLLIVFFLFCSCIRNLRGLTSSEKQGDYELSKIIIHGRILPCIIKADLGSVQ